MAVCLCRTRRVWVSISTAKRWSDTASIDAPPSSRPRAGRVGAMEYATLGRTPLRVSRVCLGTVFRSEADEQTCLAAIDEAAVHGCNFIDCANVYREGLSERIVGRAIRGRRDRFV